jgi:hypothetical protein
MLIAGPLPSPEVLMIRTLFVAFALPLLSSAAAGRDPDDLPGPKIEWPEVRGLERGKTNVFKDAKLGYSVPYTGDGATITVFVYNLGRTEIEAGVQSDALKGEMYEAAVAVEGNKATGRYKSIQPLDDQVITFGKAKGAPEIRRKRYEVEINKEGEAITELYLTVYDNHFIKLRATYPTEDKDVHQKHLQSLLDSLGKQLK